MRRYSYALALLLLLGCASATAQAPPAASPPPSAANDPPVDPGADEMNAAARKGDVAAVKALLDKGISPDARWRYAMTALFPACDRGHIEVVRLLLERGANPNVRDRFYNATPLTWALNKDHAGIAVLLLEKGAANNDRVVAAAIELNSVDLMRVSLAKGGLQPVALTAALAGAMRAGKNEMVELLKGAGAQPPFDVEASLLAVYAGTYRSENAQNPLVLNWVVKDGALEGGVVGPQPPLHLFATDEVTFRTLEPTGLVITFAKDGSELSLLQGTQTTKFKKEVKP
jgi:hypothetical protein